MRQDDITIILMGIFSILFGYIEYRYRHAKSEYSKKFFWGNRLLTVKTSDEIKTRSVTLGYIGMFMMGMGVILVIITVAHW